MAIARSLQRADVIALLALAGATCLAAWQLLYGGTLIGQDSATQFYPWYDYLGERLRAGEIPGWNPHQFGGAPFAADPQSGWMYLPAMLLFAALPLSLAVPAFLIVHLALAGFATYALARALKIGAGGALVAAIAYELSGPVLGRSVCCPASFEVSVWMPVALLGAEIAIGGGRDRRRYIIGWAVAGLALSQGLAAWLGQGVYYLLLVLSGFIAYRTLIAPPGRARRIAVRFRDVALHGGAILLIGFGLAAASVLPRLAYIGRSNLADGEYSGHNAWAAEIGGVTPGMVIERLLDPTLHYPGAIAVILSVMAVYLARRWRAAPFFAGFGIVALILATPWQTPLHLALYAVLPRFEALHEHRPERVAMVGFLAIAIMAGAAVHALQDDDARRGRVRLIAGLVIAAVLALLALRADTPMETFGWAAAAAGLLGAVVLLDAQTVRWAVPSLLAMLVTVDLMMGFNGLLGSAPYGGFYRVDLDRYYAPSGAVAFLEENTANGKGRYFGFDPELRAITDGQRVLYRNQFGDASTGALLVNNRGTLHGLEDVQGYNPVQPRRFTEYLTALNGRPQEYHDANVFYSGINSPLLDLLNVRYIVIPATTTDRPDLIALDREFPTVYSDSQVEIQENREALPRAWVVHDARQVATGEALSLIASGEVDPRLTALLEDPLPPLAPATDPAAEHVELTAIEPDKLRVSTHTTAPGLLMLSEAYDPDWRAYIDGEPAPVMVADHLLRAVPLPAGDHIVELRYEPRLLDAGIVISAATSGILVALLMRLGWQRWYGRTGQPVPRQADSSMPVTGQDIGVDDMRSTHSRRG